MPNGEFRRYIDCRLSALAILGMCNGAIGWYGRERGATVELIAAEFTRMATAGLLARLLPVST